MGSWSKNDLLGIVSDPVNKSQFTPNLTLVDFYYSKQFQSSICSRQIVVSPQNNDRGERSTRGEASQCYHGEVVTQVEPLPSDLAHCEASKHEQSAAEPEHSHHNDSLSQIFVHSDTVLFVADTKVLSASCCVVCAARGSRGQIKSQGRGGSEKR
jgi:hypothetical protein